MRLGIVIPCHNEVAVLPQTSARVSQLVGRLVTAGKISADSTVYFIDDGSRDSTWALIEQLASENRSIAGIRLSRNFGHQNAVIAGLFAAAGDAVVSIDADLQDDIDAIEEMVDKCLAGAEIVYGVRRRRDTDSAFKRASAQGFYWLMHALGADSIYNHADYRLMSRRAIECLKEYREVNLYLRGIVPLIGFRSEVVHYDRGNRLAGESKYPLRKMVSLALDAITSFSVVPLRLITIMGFIIFFGSMGVTLWVFWVKLFTDAAVPGWTSIALPMYFLGGLQLLSIGILGEYLGKTYGEIKARPRYFIDEMVGSDVRREPPRPADGDADAAPRH